MNRRERNALVEQVGSAWRPPDPRGGVRPHPAFFDLDADARQRAAARAETQRAIEAAADRDGLSSTVRAVLARIRG